jgi:hypothetical protein
VPLEWWGEGKLQIAYRLRPEPHGRGRIVESWVNYDALALLQQLGLVPPVRGIVSGVKSHQIRIGGMSAAAARAESVWLTMWVMATSPVRSG